MQYLQMPSYLPAPLQHLPKPFAANALCCRQGVKRIVDCMFIKFAKKLKIKSIRANLTATFSVKNYL